MAYPPEFSVLESPEIASPDIPVTPSVWPPIRVVPAVIEVDGKILLEGVDYAEPGWHSVVALGVRTDLMRVAFQTPHDADEEPLSAGHSFHDSNTLRNPLAARSLDYAIKTMQNSAGRVAISRLLGY